jgi:SAM-dependent methyltransferase
MGFQAPPYQLLAGIYDGGWSDYSEYIHELILQVEAESRRVFGRVCDAACGTGVLLSLLRDDGAQRRLAGYDNSAAMLEIARSRFGGDVRTGWGDGDARGDAGGVLLSKSDLREPIPFPPPFDLITCVYDSLNYLTEADEMRRFFGAAGDAAAEGTLLLCDANARQLYRNRKDERQVRLIDGIPLRQRLTFDPGPPPIARTQFAFDEGTETHVQRAWDPEEIERFLEETGWNLLDTLDVMDADTDEPSGKVVYLAVPAE